MVYNNNFQFLELTMHGFLEQCLTDLPVRDDHRNQQ